MTTPATTATTSTDNATDQGGYTVKVRRGDDLRRFAFSGDYASLLVLLRRLFVIAEAVPIRLQYRDDENDLVTLSSDTELAEARANNPRILHLVLSVPDALVKPVVVPQPVPLNAGAPQFVPRGQPVMMAPVGGPVLVPPAGRPVPMMPYGQHPHAPIHGGPHARGGHGPHWGHPRPHHPGWGHGPHPHPPATPVAPSVHPTPGANPAATKPDWKHEKAELINKWKGERTLLKDQIRAMKASNQADKKALKEQIKQLRQQMQATKKELQHMPKEAAMIARFVTDVSLPDGSEVAPGAQLVKTWRFRNESPRAWPEGSYLMVVGKKSDLLGAPETSPVPICAPGQEVDVSVPLVAPIEAGRYTAYFRLAGPQGKKFGQRVWAMITVFESSSSSDGSTSDSSTGKACPQEKVAPQLKMLAEMGYTDVKVNLKLLKKTGGNLEKTVALLIKRQQKKGALPTH